MKIHYKETSRPGYVQITTLDERFYRRESDKKIFASNTWICSYVPMDDFLIEWIANKGIQQAKEERNKRGRSGSIVHAAIESFLKTGEAHMGDVFPDGDGQSRELEPEEYHAVMQFRSWWLDDYMKENKGAKVLEIERDYYNEELGYACTADLVVKCGNRVDVIDFKTSQSIQLEHLIQLEGIVHCDELRDKNCTKNNLQIGYRRNKSGYKYSIHEEDEWQTFLSAYHFWARENKHKQPKQFEYPLKLTLKD